MGGPATNEVHRRAGTWRQVWWRELLVVFGLTGFAISQPLLSVLGQNPTVFTAHGVDGASLVVFALSLTLGPPLALWAVGLLVTGLRPRAGFAVHLLTVAVLVSLTAIQVLKALGVEQTVVVAALGLAAGIALAWAYDRYGPVATWLQFTAVLPAMALFLFLATSPTGDLLRDREAVAAATDPDDLPAVVMVVLDELPTKSLLDTDGSIDAGRYPNLAEFAGDATWYRHHTTVAPSTQFAVPALLTGNAPRQVDPLWTNYPDNLFSLLAPTHDLVAFESATELCGLANCSESAPASTGRTTRLRDLVATTADVFRERVSPTPNRGERLDTFEEQVRVEPVAEPDESATPDAGGYLDTSTLVTRLSRADEFVDTLEPPRSRPVFYFLHLVVPHSPWRFYPDGEIYDAEPESDTYPFTAFNDEGDWVAAVTEQRHLLQAQYADSVVGDLLTALKRHGLYDEALVIVVADHGISFENDTPTRSLNDDSLAGIDGLAYSPLLIKAPGQDLEAVDDANVMTIDLLPTVADMLGLEVPFPVTGQAVGTPGATQRGDEKLFYDIVGPVGDKELRGVIEYPDDHAPTAADRWIGPSGPDDDPLAGLYQRFGLTDLIGRPLDELVTDEGEGQAEISSLPRLRSTGAGAVPLGTFVGRVVSPDDEGVVVAAVDGRVVAASPLHPFKGEPRSFTLLFPPGVVADGDLRLALVSETGATELELTG